MIFDIWLRELKTAETAAHRIIAVSFMTLYVFEWVLFLTESAASRPASSAMLGCVLSGDMLETNWAIIVRHLNNGVFVMSRRLIVDRWLVYCCSWIRRLNVNVNQDERPIVRLSIKLTGRRWPLHERLSVRAEELALKGSSKRSLLGQFFYINSSGL